MENSFTKSLSNESNEIKERFIEKKNQNFININDVNRKRVEIIISIKNITIIISNAKENTSVQKLNRQFLES